MSSGDLKHLLQDLATEGTTRVDLDEQQLVTRIHTRRRRRAGLVAAVSASTAVVLAAGAYVVLPGGEREQPPTAIPTPTPTVVLTPGRSATMFSCGATFTAPVAGDPSLRVAVTQQEVTRGADGNAVLSVQVTNTTSHRVDLFSNGGGPRIYVVKDGVVVAVPGGETMPGKHTIFDPGTTTWKMGLPVRCRSDAALPGAVQLEPGSYQIYAMKTYRQSGAPYLPEVTVAGGPWTIQLK